MMWHCSPFNSMKYFLKDLLIFDLVFHMHSIFITGTDTDVGKTIFSSALSKAIRDIGYDVGVMKPFASGNTIHSPYKSLDVLELVNASKSKDDDQLINPYFFKIPASPFFGSNHFSKTIDLNLVFNAYEKLSKSHDLVIVEGIGGVMTPILKNYFISNLIKDLCLDVIIVCGTRIGSVNHFLMTQKTCELHGLNIRGVVINDCVVDGYELNSLENELSELTSSPIICKIPFIQNKHHDVSKIISSQINLKDFFSS